MSEFFQRFAKPFVLWGQCTFLPSTTMTPLVWDMPSPRPPMLASVMVRCTVQPFGLSFSRPTGTQVRDCSLGAASMIQIQQMNGCLS